jgi:hypothetical protein
MPVTCQQFLLLIQGTQYMFVFHVISAPNMPWYNKAEHHPHMT